ncbi:MAG: hypothetical protein MJZ31_05020 [Bacteroidales bacterium]|nr:hypothetical protein [Bacteroidales bacterium]
MKTLLGLLMLVALSFAAVAPVSAEELVLKGTYQGENIYVRNPFAPSGVGFCAYEVTVNGQITTDEINSSAFEIDLSVYGFNVGDEVAVVIKYKDDCLPMILNNYALQVKKPAAFEGVSVKNGVLTFKTTGETGSISFYIEQFRWNKWVRVGEVKGKGKNQPNSYDVKVRTHSGPNKFRVRQTDGKKISVYSKEALEIVTAPAVTFKASDTQITFSAETMYEIYDQFGGIVFKGFGSTINISTLQKGKYYLNYDNSQSEFVKK